MDYSRNVMGEQEIKNKQRLSFADKKKSKINSACHALTGAVFLCECGINLLRGLFAVAGEAVSPACEAAFGLGGS